jgi:fibronectin type 3 domain-containing protein
MTAPSTPNEVKLGTPKQAADAGGTVDRTVQKGETYRYTARRLREISLEGHALELRSDLSSPVKVTMLDTFPPGIPTELEAVPGGATASDRSIDLSWAPDTDSDLAGYSVYRQEVTSAGQVAGTATRLNTTPIVGPAYRDQTAVPGHRYAYRVTAVDASGNESAPSADVQETLREQ